MKRMAFIEQAIRGLRRLFLPRPRGIVLALGGGGAAGLAHIGVLQVLAENQIPIRGIVGSSIGAEIGAFHAAGMPVAELVDIATAFDWKQTLGLFFPDLPTGGLISGVKIVTFLRSRLRDCRIEDLAIGYVAVAADLSTGAQVLLDSGDLVDAVRASVSIPGLIAPLTIAGRVLVDGGVVNPLPFDVARERFGGPVVAVAVHAGARAATAPAPRKSEWIERAQQLLDQPWTARAPGLRDWLNTQLDNRRSNRSEKNPWTTRRVLDRVVDMSQAEIVRLRSERDPPDLLLLPKVGDIGTFEFYRGKEAIAAGRQAAQERINDIKKLARSKS